MSFVPTVVVMPGSMPVGLPMVRAIADDFGWKVEVALTLDEVARLRDDSKPLAVLCQEDSLGRSRPWVETIRAFKSAVSDVRLIACHGFSDAVDWPAMARAGAFHGLWLPLKESEVRQSFGFVCLDERRSAGDGRLIELPAAAACFPAVAIIRRAAR
jgi:hypothetical protein